MGDFFGLLGQTMLLTIPTTFVLGGLFLLFYNYDSVWQKIKSLLSKKSKNQVLVPNQKKLIEAALEANEEIRLPMEQILYIIRHWNDYNFFSTEDGKIAVKKIKEVLKSQKTDLVIDDKEVKGLKEGKSVNFKNEQTKDEDIVKVVEPEQKNTVNKNTVKPFKPDKMTEAQLQEIHKKVLYVDEHFYVLALDEEYKLIVDGFIWRKTETSTNRIVEQGTFKEQEELKHIKREHYEKTSKKYNNIKSTEQALAESEFVPTTDEEKIAKEISTHAFQKFNLDDTQSEKEIDELISKYEATLKEQRKKENEEKAKIPPPSEEGKMQMLDVKELSKSLNRDEVKQQEPKPQSKKTRQQNHAPKKEKQPFWLSHEFVDIRSLVQYFCAHDNSFQTNIEDFFMWLGENFQHVYLEEKKHLYIAPSSLLCGITSTIKNTEQQKNFLNHFFTEHQLHVPRLEEFITMLRSQMELKYGFTIFDRYKKIKESKLASLFKVGLLSRGERFQGIFLKIRISKKTFPNFLNDEVVGRLTLCELLTANSLELEKFNGKEVKVLGREEVEKWIIV